MEVTRSLSTEFIRRMDFHPRRNLYDHLFLYLLVASTFLRVLWLDKPTDSLIFDERRASARPS